MISRARRVVKDAFTGSRGYGVTVHPREASQSKSQRWRSIWLISGSLRPSRALRPLRLDCRRSAIPSHPPDDLTLWSSSPSCLHASCPVLHSPHQPTTRALNFRTHHQPGCQDRGPPEQGDRFVIQLPSNRVTGSRFCHPTGRPNRVTGSTSLIGSRAGRGPCRAFSQEGNPFNNTSLEGRATASPTSSEALHDGLV